MLKLFKTLALCTSALLLVLFISGCHESIDSKTAAHAAYQMMKPLGEDVAPKGEEASHTTYEVSKPFVKDLTLNDEFVCQIRSHTAY